MRARTLAALALALAAPVSHAAAVAVTWLPVAGASGYRIERATKPTGPWKVYRDQAPQRNVRPSDLQVASVDGFRARGQACIRVLSIYPGPVFSTPSETACATLPREALDLSTLGNATPAPPAPPPVVAPVWRYCAGEGEPCAFTGTRRVRFGYGDAFKELTLTNGASCSVATFGDPIRGQWKFCEVAE